MPVSRSVPSSPNPSSQVSPRAKERSNPGSGEPTSAFRGISRGRGGRGGSVRGGRGSSTPKGGSCPDAANSTPSLLPAEPSVMRKSLVPTSTAAALNGLSEKTTNGSTERGGRPRPGSRKQPRVPAVVISTTSPPQTLQTTPPTPSRSVHRRRRPQSGKGSSISAKPPTPSSSTKTQGSKVDPTLSSQAVLRKDAPPHLAAVHEAEIRHDIDALVERVRAVAMAENRPTTPGSHIDWAGDEDDSLPNLDDWGVTTTCTDAMRDEGQSEEISPILVDALRTLPEPNSEIHQEEVREMENYDVELDQIQVPSVESLFLPSPTKGKAIVSPSAEESQDRYITIPTSVEEPSSTLPTLHPSLLPEPVATMECLRARGRSIDKPSNVPPRPSVFVTEEEVLTTKIGALADSAHAPSTDERLALESVSSAPSSERGLTASIHAPVPGLPESHSAPSLLSIRPTSADSHTHSRSQTEGRPGTHQLHNTSLGTISQRHRRSGASSPLGKHVYTHSRNHSTPAVGSRLPQASRPVITGEAISRLARTIGGHGSASRTQTIPVTQDSTISS